MYLFAFEKLQVWQEARTLIVAIYKATEKFPGEEKFGLTNQLRRAAVSIASNITEGSGRASVKDQAHFYNMANSSLMELYNQLIISNDLGWLSKDDLDRFRNEIGKISSKINALKKAILKKGDVTNSTPQHFNSSTSNQ